MTPTAPVFKSLAPNAMEFHLRETICAARMWVVHQKSPFSSQRGGGGGASFLGARESLVGIIRSDILRPFVVRILGTRQGEDDPCQKRHFEFSHCVTRRSIFIPRLLGCGWCIISGQAKWNFAARWAKLKLNFGDDVGWTVFSENGVKMYVCIF